MLGDGTAEERAAAAEALGKLARNMANKAAMAAAGAMEPLVALVRDGDPQGKANAAGALWTLAAGDAAIKAAMAATGYSLKDARAAGFTCQEARAAGFTCQEARAAGFKPRDCKQAGFTFEEGKAAGFPTRINWQGIWYDQPQVLNNFWDYGKSPPEIRTPVDRRPRAPLRLAWPVPPPLTSLLLCADNYDWDGTNLGR